MISTECALVLNAQREPVQGSTERLNLKLRHGADLRIRTEFRHNEHIDVHSDDNQLVTETSTFAQTMLIDGNWSAYFMTLRQPVALRDGFGAPHALSLFLYNQNAQQALARLTLDRSLDRETAGEMEYDGFRKMHTMGSFDAHTRGASKNFIYDFESYHFIVKDHYEEIYANDRSGQPIFGTAEQLDQAYNEQGRGIKLSIAGLSAMMWGNKDHEDEVFVHCGSSYFYTQDRLMIANTLPFVSVPAAVPVMYRSEGFRYCWCIARTDGRVVVRSYNPFSDTWETKSDQLPLRWFAQK